MNEAVDALVHDAPGVRIVGERVLPVRYSLLARARRAAPGRARRALPSAGARAVRALAARHAAGRRGARRARRRRRRSARSPAGDDDAVAGARARRSPASSTAPSCSPRTSATRRTRRASSGSRRQDAPAPRTRATGRGRARSSSPATATARPGGSCAACRSSPTRDVNLTRIESRPSRRRLGHYVFLLDLDGRADVPGPAAEALAALRPLCEDLRLIGSYPRAADAPTA